MLARYARRIWAFAGWRLIKDPDRIEEAERTWQLARQRGSFSVRGRRFGLW